MALRRKHPCRPPPLSQYRAIAMELNRRRLTNRAGGRFSPTQVVRMLEVEGAAGRGLDPIYIQAKRWEGTVGRPEIQQFVGALHGRCARKGVFITTSSLSGEAIGYVSP